MSIYPRSGARELRRFAIFEILYNAQKWECIFTLRLNIEKDIDYMGKIFILFIILQPVPEY